MFEGGKRACAARLEAHNKSRREKVKQRRCAGGAAVAPAQPQAQSSASTHNSAGSGAGPTHGGSCGTGDATAALADADDGLFDLADWMFEEAPAECAAARSLVDATAAAVKVAYASAAAVRHAALHGDIYHAPISASFPRVPPPLALLPPPLVLPAGLPQPDFGAAASAAAAMGLCAEALQLELASRPDALPPSLRGARESPFGVATLAALHASCRPGARF
jgi:hypothetical protein